MEKRVLLLTPWMFPIAILHWHDAVKMKYEGTVDVLAEYGEEISSPSVTWRVPAVVRLKRLPQNKKRGAKFSRSNVYERDQYRCQYCGQKKKARELTYDHVVPKSRGGRKDWDNIVAACTACNARKDDQSCDESGMYPIRAPHKPRSLPLTSPLIDPANVPDEWREFVAAE
jgi:5-methylcytosine-specific restriction endonuclease McrA